MKKPTTMEEYLYLIDQSCFDAGDLMASEGWDETETDLDMRFAPELGQQLLALQASITDGSYQFEDVDLPFMETVNKYRRFIPFTDLLRLINDTHRNGLG